MLLYFDNVPVLLIWAIAAFSLNFLATLLALGIRDRREKQRRAKLARRIARSDTLQLMIHNLATEEMEEHTNAQLDIPERPTNLDSPLS